MWSMRQASSRAKPARAFKWGPAPVPGSSFGVFLSGLCLSPGRHKGAADDPGSNEGYLGYNSMGL